VGHLPVGIAPSRLAEVNELHATSVVTFLIKDVVWSTFAVNEGYDNAGIVGISDRSVLLSELVDASKVNRCTHEGTIAGNCTLLAIINQGLHANDRGSNAESSIKEFQRVVEKINVLSTRQTNKADDNKKDRVDELHFEDGRLFGWFEGQEKEYCVCLKSRRRLVWKR